MKTKHWITRDAAARQYYSPVEVKKLVLQSLLANGQNVFPWSHKFYWTYLFHKAGLRRRLSFFRHGCLWSSTGRSVFRFFKFSRHWCKHFASEGVLVGMRKSSF